MPVAAVTKPETTSKSVAAMIATMAKGRTLFMGSRYRNSQAMSRQGRTAANAARIQAKRRSKRLDLAGGLDAVRGFVIPAYPGSVRRGAQVHARFLVLVVALVDVVPVHRGVRLCRGRHAPVRPSQTRPPASCRDRDRTPRCCPRACPTAGTATARAKAEARFEARRRESPWSYTTPEEAGKRGRRS